MEPVPGGEILLPGELRSAIRRERLQIVVLAGGPLALAVDRASARGEDDASPGRARRLEHPHRPDDVDVGVEGGPLDRRPDVGLRREVEDDLRPDPRSELLQRLVADVELLELGRRREVVPRAKELLTSGPVALELPAGAAEPTALDAAEQEDSIHEEEISQR